MWEVITKGHTVRTKIVDNDWLDIFHDRQVALLPGDALSADVRIDTHLDEDDQPFDTKYTVEKIHQITKADREQLELNFDEEDLGECSDE